MRAEDGRTPGSGGRGRPRPTDAGANRRGDVNRDRPGRAGTAGPRWGAIARRGAAELASPVDGSRRATETWREAVAEARGIETWQPGEDWVLEVAEDESERPRRGPRPEARAAGHRRTVPAPVVAEITSAVGEARGTRLAARLADATQAYDRERYQDARRVLRPLAAETPSAPAIRELYGLTLYRLGQWDAAARQLEAYRSLSGSYDQHPVLADCYRALRRYDEAEVLWEELRAASPDADVVAEGRIVAAGCRADQGDLPGAIALLERSLRSVGHPRDRHLRQWYMLADLYERAGELPRAREMFRRVGHVDPDAFDVRQRLRALR